MDGGANTSIQDEDVRMLHEEHRSVEVEDPRINIVTITGNLSIKNRIWHKLRC